MFEQVMNIMVPDKSYTSNGTWDSVVFNDGRVKPDVSVYEEILYKLTNVKALEKMRDERNTLLDKTDKYIVNDYPHKFENIIEEYKKYRQVLRDITLTARPTLDENGDLVDMVWPTPPTINECGELVIEK